jgi:hypothetical protein
VAPEIRSTGYAFYDPRQFPASNSNAAAGRNSNRLSIGSPRRRSLDLCVAGDITRSFISACGAVPCASGRDHAPRNHDSRFNFEVFSQTFQQDYAFFDRHGVD